MNKNLETYITFLEKYFMDPLVLVVFPTILSLLAGGFVIFIIYLLYLWVVS